MSKLIFLTLFFMTGSSPLWAFSSPASPDIPAAIFQVDSFGAHPGDDNDDTAAIQAAIDAAVSAGGGTIQFGAGIYLIHVNASSPNTVLVIHSKLRLLGSSLGSTVIQLAADQPAYGAIFGTLWPYAPAVNDFILENITIDSNGQNNPVSSNVDTFAAGGRLALRLYISVGARFKISHTLFLNETNVNVVSFNGGISDVEVANCEFRNVGGGAWDYDHSTIYTHAVRVWIHDNLFTSRSGPGTPGARTAIEIHGDDHRLEGNRIDGYLNGMNVTGVAKSSNRILVEHNTLVNVYIGMELWSYFYNGNTDQPALQNVTIRNNQISLAVLPWRLSGLIYYQSPAAGILLEPNSDAPIEALEIANNTIDFSPTVGAPVSGDSYSSGICLWRSAKVIGVPVFGVNIVHNRITNALGAGIWSNAALVGGTSVSAISDNTIINPGRSSLSNGLSMRSGIYVTGNTQDLEILGNTISETVSPAHLRLGVGALSVCNSQCMAGDNNAVIGAAVPAFQTDPSWGVTNIPVSLMLPGDVSGDGRVTMYDAALVLKYTVGGQLKNAQQAQADINSDTTVDAADAMAIAKKALGLK